MIDLSTILDIVTKTPENYLVGLRAKTTIYALSIANNFEIIYCEDFTNKNEADKTYNEILLKKVSRDYKYSANISNCVYVRKK